MNLWRTGSALSAHAFAVLLVAGVRSVAIAGPGLTAAYAAQPYTFAKGCDAAQPLVFINLMLRNGRFTTSGPVHLTARDGVHVLEGDATLPQIPPGTESAAILPLRRIVSSPGPLAGTHVITVTVVEGGDSKHLTALEVPVPATLCATAMPSPVPSTAPPGAPSAGTAAHSPLLKTETQIAVQKTESAIAMQKPTLSHTYDPISSHLAVLQKPAVPANVHSVAGGTDCATHVGPIGALVCPDLIKLGDLLLIWDWRSDGGVAGVDGYRVYRVDSALKQLVATRASQDLTLADIPPPAGGYGGRCYAVSAYTSKAESDLSAAFCAGGGSVAKTVRLQATQARSQRKVHDDGGNVFTGYGSLAGKPGRPVQTDLIVGFNYASAEHTLGDTVLNEIFRAAVAFDVSTLANRRLVAAKLRMTIVDSKGAGNNHSCITNVATGTEFWWRNNDWPEARSASIAPTDTGPEITADVTQLVAPWFRGEPNYGFVLINSDENLGAFTNKECQTSYNNAILEITYY